MAVKAEILEGNSFVLRPLEEKDLEGNYPAWFTDPEVTRFNSHGRAPIPAARMLEYVQRSQTAPELLVMAIVLKEGKRHVGNIALQNISASDKSAEYAVIIGEKDVWGKGLAREASLLLLRYGFEKLNLHRIYCGTSEKNLPMQKLAAAMGMREEGRRRQAFFKNGEYLDVLEYGILKSEFRG